MKICPMGTKMFHASGWTDMTKLIISFCDFANALKEFGPWVTVITWTWGNPLSQTAIFRQMCIEKVFSVVNNYKATAPLKRWWTWK